MDESPLVHIEQANIQQEHHVVLKDVNVDVYPGEFVYLIGRTGSGKSSLLKTMYGELPLDNGSATVVDHDLLKLKRRDIPGLRRKLGIVFQDFQLLFDRSVHDNLLFVMKATGWKDKDQMSAKITELLESVGLPTKGYKMPHELSGGEQQRVAIARALINDPPLILADEPTGNLDPDTSKEIMELLHQIIGTGKAIVMATHDYNMINQYPGRILRCENGTINQDLKVAHE